jgi:hypothetical protein
MTARRCFTGKVAAGKVSQRAAQPILDMLDAFEREHAARLGDTAGARQAAMDTAAIAAGEAARNNSGVLGSIVAQANVLRAFQSYDQVVQGLRQTKGDFFGLGNKAPPSLGKSTQTTLGFAVRSLLARDPWEIATWGNVNKLAQTIRGEAHRHFAEAIEFLRPKGLGFKNETVRELDVLRAIYGRTDVDPQARAVADAWSQRVAEPLADQFIAAGGALGKRERWRLPNPTIDETKVRALGAERFKALVRDTVDRNDIIDFDTGKPMNNVRFERLLEEATQSILSGGAQSAVPSAAHRGGRMLANSRNIARFFSFKDAESWTKFAEGVGAHSSVFETMTGHIEAMANDVAMLRTLGPNPDATKRFILDLFDREAGRLSVTANEDGAFVQATRQNRQIEARVRRERRMFEDLWAEVSGENRIPVSTTFAQNSANVRHWLSSTQLGSAMISSLTDPGMMMMAARFNGLPVMGTFNRAVAMMKEPGAEVFAAQQGLVLDTLAHAAGVVDRVMGEEIRTGFAAKLSSANIRVSGLRRWTGILRAAFGLEMMAHVARERGKNFGELEAVFRSSLERYGIGAEDWDVIRNATPHEPRANAQFLRPADVMEGGTGVHQAASDKLSRLINQEMDYAVIEGDPVTRALLIGQSLPGTAGGELRRSVTMYRSFPATFITMHFARALARGWDGKRLSHAAVTFATMTMLGALAMQAKEIAKGRDPLSLNPTEANGARAWGAAVLQGGGLGVFGDLLFLDQTKYGNSWAATLAGPVAGAVETVLGDFVFKNIQNAGKGKDTHFLGDALYTAARYTPGTSLWYARLAFQRHVVDQLALMADDRTRERFARIETTARKEWGQSFWWRPGRREADRVPDLAAIGGGER